MKSPMLRIFLAVVSLTDVVSSALVTADASPNDTAIVCSQSNKISYDLKREALLAELQIRTSASANAVSILYQYRLALITVLTGLLAFLFARHRKAKDEKGHENPTSAKIIVILSLGILAFFMYWSDCYLTDLQQRVEHRATNIGIILGDLPSMRPDQIDTLKIYPSLAEQDPWRKVSLLWSPNIEQIFSYIPSGILLIIILAYFIFEARTKKRRHVERQPHPHCGG